MPHSFWDARLIHRAKYLGVSRETASNYIKHLVAKFEENKRSVIMRLSALGWSTEEWSYRLSAAAWTLLYYQVEILLEAHTNHITESNFVPAYADPQWQALKQRFDFHLIQVRCECDPDVLLQRYRNRILTGERHPGHRDGGDESAFHKLMHAGPME